MAFSWYAWEINESIKKSVNNLGLDFLVVTVKAKNYSL